jgi:hypothetical protein
MVDYMPEANGRGAVLAHRIHNLRGQRMLDACQRERVDLRRGGRRSNKRKHDFNYAPPADDSGWLTSRDSMTVPESAIVYIGHVP